MNAKRKGILAAAAVATVSAVVLCRSGGHENMTAVLHRFNGPSRVLHDEGNGWLADDEWKILLDAPGGNDEPTRDGRCSRCGKPVEKNNPNSATFSSVDLTVGDEIFSYHYSCLSPRMLPAGKSE